MQYVVHETDKRKMKQLKLCVEDGKYSKYSYLDVKTMKETENQPDINPAFNKLFNQDIIEVDMEKPLTMKLLHSSVRSMKNIPGVLVLDNNKTYGKISNSVFINQTATAFSNTGAWHHVALIKVANAVGLYVDGTQIIYTTFSTTRDFAAVFNIGSQDGSSDFYNGYMDEVRWSNSNPFSATPVVGKTDTITVPTAAYSTGAAQTNQRILSGSVDISGQPAGSNMKYKVETLNNKNLKLHGASLLWA